MPYKNALRKVCTPFARWQLSTFVNAMIILETLEDAVRVALRPRHLRGWREIADDIEALPLTVKTGVMHGVIMIIILWALEEGNADYRLMDTVLLGAASYLVTYCLAVLAGKPMRIRRPRAHWVGENVVTQPGRK